MARMMVDPEEKRKAYELAKEQAREFAEFIAEPKEKRYRHFDSGVYNSIVNGYVIAAMQDAGKSGEEISSVLASLKIMFDEMTSAEAEDVWMKW